MWDLEMHTPDLSASLKVWEVDMLRCPSSPFCCLGEDMGRKWAWVLLCLPALESSDARLPGTLSLWLAGAGVSLGVHGLRTHDFSGRTLHLPDEALPSCGAGAGRGV